MGLDFSGSPNAGVYMQQAAQAQQAYDQALANVNARRSQLYNGAGFKVNTNPDGTIKDYAVDGTNLAGGYQQMQRAQGLQLEAQHEADASRHLGGAGIGSQNTSALRYANGVQQAGFANNFLANNEALVQEQSGLGANLQNTLLGLQMQAIADARAAQNFPDTGDGSDGGGAGGGGKTPAGKYVSPVLRSKQTRPYAVKVAANKTGASANKKQGIFAIH